MVAMGLLLIHRGKGVKGAQSYGKICTAVMDVSCFLLLLFPNLSFARSSALIGIMMVTTIITWIKYIKFYATA